MKTVIAAIGMSVAFGAVPAAGQAQWDAREIQGGVEFQLRNDDGAAIFLACVVRGVAVGFAFARPMERTERATVRGFPGARENIAVAPVNDHIVQIVGARGVDFALGVLRTAANLSVLASGQRAHFKIFGSDAIVSQCQERQEDPTGNPNLSMAGYRQ